MKILYISSSIIPSKNANSVHVMKMCNALQENGHDVTLVATRGNINLDMNIRDYYDVNEKFEIKLSKQMKVLSPLFRLCLALKCVKGKDIIYTRWPLAAAVLSILYSKEIILEYHSYPTNIL